MGKSQRSKEPLQIQLKQGPFAASTTHTARPTDWKQRCESQPEYQ